MSQKSLERFLQAACFLGPFIHIWSITVIQMWEFAFLKCADENCLEIFTNYQRKPLYSQTVQRPVSNGSQIYTVRYLASYLIKYRIWYRVQPEGIGPYWGLLSPCVCSKHVDNGPQDIAIVSHTNRGNCKMLPSSMYRYLLLTAMPHGCCFIYNLLRNI